MSDEFLKVATKEINEEVDSIGKILDSCNDDAAILQNSSSLEKHFHKIKGLAPMMGQEEIGEIAALIDFGLPHEKVFKSLSLLKTLMD